MRKAGILAVSIAAIGMAASANAAPLYGSEYGGTSIYAIDASDGSFVSIGAASDNTPGLAYNGVTGTLYANSQTELYTVDTSNAALTLVGAFGGAFLGGLTFSADFSTLYALNASGGFGTELHAIDPMTGAAVLIGATGATGINLDLATHSNGTVYMAGFNNLYTLDTATGAATLVAALSNSASQTGLTAISFDENDVLYGVTTSGDVLVTIDILTGIVTTVGGDIGNDVRGLAFAIEATAMPEPAVLSLFGLGLAGIGLAARRRQAR